MKSVYLSVVIPAYNEAERIAHPLTEIIGYLAKQSYSWEVVVVNDGSTDRTEQIVSDLKLPGVRMVGYAHNQGKGYAVNFGFQNSVGEYFLMCDSDNSTPFYQVDKLLALVNNYSVIIGSRRLQGSLISKRQPMSRLLASIAGNWMIQILLLPGIPDTQCGFKLFSKSSALEIAEQQSIWRWGFDIELLYIAKKHKLTVAQVPIEWRDVQGSKVQSIRAFCSTLSELWQIKLNGLHGKYSKI